MMEHKVESISQVHFSSACSECNTEARLKLQGNADFKRTSHRQVWPCGFSCTTAASDCCRCVCRRLRLACVNLTLDFMERTGGQGRSVSHWQA